MAIGPLQFSQACVPSGAIPRNYSDKLYHPGLAEINAPIGSQEVVGHTFDLPLLIG